MDTIIALAFGALQRLGMAALLVMVHSELLRRLDGRTRLQDVATGVLFGFGAVVASLNPSPLHPAVAIDARSIMIGLAGPFGGWTGTLVAAGIAGAYRIYLGGTGAAASLIEIEIAAAAGLAFAQWFGRPPEFLRVPSLAILGAMTSLCGIGALALPSQASWPAFLGGAAVSAAFTAFGIVVVGRMLVQERRRVTAEGALREGAMVDPLTGLANRRAFHDCLVRQVARCGRGETPLGLISLDVDAFKSLNDRHGHEAGDAALVALGEALRRTCREGDLPARIGGDEFSIVLPATDARGAREMAERMLAEIGLIRMETDDGEVSFSVSLGAASFSLGMSAEDLRRAADEALYRAKNAGRNRVATDQIMREAA